MKASRILANGFDGILSATGFISGLLMVLLSVFVGIQVIARYIFSVHIRGLFDLSAYSLIIITFLGGAYTLRAGRHISVDIISLHFPERAREKIGIVMSLMSLVFFIFLLYQKFQLPKNVNAFQCLN